MAYLDRVVVVVVGVIWTPVCKWLAANVAASGMQDPGSSGLGVAASLCLPVMLAALLTAKF